MITMVAELLEYARVGGARPKRGSVDLAEIARAVVEDLDAEITKTGATVTADAAIQVVGDATLLRALLQNLVANALKFSHAAGSRPLVEIRGHALAGGWRVTVDDNGPGVPAAEREKVFELMERGTATAAPGLGIGLSTCRRIVEAHGGRIGIDDSPLGGASIWIVLPAADSVGV
jgi:signal transduction histidine kinase